MSNDQDIRTQFEQWVKDRYATHPNTFRRTVWGEYYHTIGNGSGQSEYANLEMLWEAWFAGRRSLDKSI